jgi:hypothetical protein
MKAASFCGTKSGTLKLATTFRAFLTRISGRDLLSGIGINQELWK